MANSRSEWWTRLTSKGPLRNRLFCFPYAGAGPSAFMKFAAHLDAGTELVLLELPGRSDRVDALPCQEMMPLLPVISEAVARFDDVPAAFFGHSLGAIMAYETARRCRSSWLQGLVVSGCIAPSFWPTPHGRRLATLDDDQLVEALVQYQGIPSQLLDDKDLLDFILPILRADFQLVGSYRYEVGEPLSLPIHVLAGADDPHVALERLANWQQETRHLLRQEILPGNHFFFEQHLDRVMVSVNSILNLQGSSAPGSLASQLIIEI